MTGPDGLMAWFGLLLMWLVGFLVALAICAGGSNRDEEGEP